VGSSAFVFSSEMLLRTQVLSRDADDAVHQKAYEGHDQHQHMVAAQCDHFVNLEVWSSQLPTAIIQATATMSSQ
jgi:hypothetical protein